jgi:hypothetical protein
MSKVLHANKFEPYNVYNDDQARVYAVQAPNKFIAVKGKKQVGFIICSESGALVVVCVTVNATDNYVLPTFIFLR